MKCKYMKTYFMFYSSVSTCIYNGNYGLDCDNIRKILHNCPYDKMESSSESD